MRIVEYPGRRNLPKYHVFIIFYVLITFFIVSKSEIMRLPTRFDSNNGYGNKLVARSNNFITGPTTA